MIVWSFVVYEPNCLCVIKILHHSVELHQEGFFTYMSSIVKTRGNSYKLFVPNSRTNARANYFSVELLMYGIGFQTKW